MNWATLLRGALLLVCGGLGCAQSRAQTPTPVPTAEPPPTTAATPPTATATQASAPGAPDLSITAQVNARELRFEVVPNPTVEFPGRPQRETVWEAERQNLPRPVQPGVTYRDIGIQLTITSVFADIDRIVAEALGEVPVRAADNNDTPPAAATPASAPFAVAPATTTAAPLSATPTTRRPPPPAASGARPTGATRPRRTGRP